MSSIQKGAPISFRLPADTPDHIVKELQKLKEIERRNFSRKIADFVIAGVSNSLGIKTEPITVSVPQPITREVEPVIDDLDDDLMDFDWEKARKEQVSHEEEVVEPKEDDDDLLGGFLANMNK